MTTRAGVTAVVFDIGGVVLDWNPRHLYRTVFDDDDEVERFLAEVCTLEWHAQHDGGRTMAETIPARCEEYPGYAREIRAWRERYVDMVGGHIDGMVELLADLRAADVACYALTNMPADVVQEVNEAFPVWSEFDGTIVSGVERLTKPDPAIYRLLTTRFGLVPNDTVFVDDMPVNVDAAWRLGFRAVRFESASQLRRVLAGWGLPVSSAAADPS